MISPVMATPTTDERLALLPGDLTLSRFEDDLSNEWPACLDGRRLHPFLVTTAFWTVLRSAADQHCAAVVLADVGPSLGAINRAALVTSDHIVVPVAPDPFSLRGLHNLGLTLHSWRDGWRKRLNERQDRGRPLPTGAMAPLGYIVLGHMVRVDRPVHAYQRWAGADPGGVS
jgi:cellulose biosynthesis protein BcsQ